MCEEGWFWLIPIDDQRMSIGLVMGTDITKQVGVPANKMLAWAMARCPAVMQRVANAVGPDTNQVIANFSYHCRPYAGPGYFLLGDAATFLDPIFSSGVCLGMMSGREAATQLQALLQGKTTPAAARKNYIRFVQNGTGVFFVLIRSYYQHSFRELVPRKRHRPGRCAFTAPCCRFWPGRFFSDDSVVPVQLAALAVVPCSFLQFEQVCTKACSAEGDRMFSLLAQPPIAPEGVMVGV